MRTILSFIMLIAALIAVSHAFKYPPGNFPGTPPFNPNQPRPWGKPNFGHRFRRSPDGKNRITVEAEKRGKSSSYDVQYGRTLYENKNGNVVLHGGMNKEPFGRPQKNIGIRGEFRF